MIDRFTLRAMQAIEKARREVEPFAGAMDGIYTSPGQVYRVALKKMGHDVSELRGFDDTNASETAFQVLRTAKTAPRRVVTDEKTVAARAERFPHGSRLVKGW
jgi:triphosphoribosyl-dephospho-CoA synthetase